MKRVYPGEHTRHAIAATLAIIFWVALIVGTVGIALLWLLLFYLVYLFAHSAFISYLKGSAVLLSEQQLPDLHARVEAASRKLGLAKTPASYVLHADGAFNALATRFLGRDYIVLFSSVLDALEDQPGAIDFYIGHELGHIHRRHLIWAPVLAPVSMLPLLGPGLARAHEYTCDRYGLAACENAADARVALAALVAGHSQRKYVDLIAFSQQRRESGGFWMSYHELTATYPWLSKRVAAIEALSRDEEPTQPSRSGFAFVLAAFTPNLGTGGAGSMLVFVAIIGILAAIAIPAYQDYINRAILTEALNRSTDAKSAIERYTLDQGKWPESLQAVGIDEPDLALGQNGKRRGVLELSAQGYLLVTLPDAPFNGGALVLSPQVSGGKIVGWNCAGEKLQPKILPPACR